MLAVFAGCAALVGATKDPSPSYDAIVAGRILPQTSALLYQLVKDKRKTTIDGVAVFNGSDRFLPGKIAVAFAQYLAARRGDPNVDEDLKNFRDIAKLTVDDANDSWGAYYYLVAIEKLKAAGLLDRAFDRLTFAKLRVTLDWRTFVDPDTYQLIDHANNYYVVAFGIARLRHDLGWESDVAAKALYQRVADHYRRHSGDFGFADETDGEGRFDRYSVLLAGELANHFVETGDRPPDEALMWLRKSADVMLQRLHADGSGFEYGRSLGPYGETAIVETLTAAARLHVLTDEDRDLAYSYATKAAQRYVDYWINPATGSVDLWDQGRRTDDYRGKFRILGENLSLAYQFAYTNDGWNAMGYKDRPMAPDFAAALDRRNVDAVTWFARGTYDRVLVTRREGPHVIGLPLISGGASQHMHHPYFPIPFSRGLLEGVPDGSAPVLVPRFTLADGTQLMPLAFIRDVNVGEAAGVTTVTYRQTELDRLGKSAPMADDRIGVTTTYTLEPGRITRTDVFTPKTPLDVGEIRLEYAGFSSEPQQNGATTRFGSGAVTSFSVEGLRACTSRPLDHDHAYGSDT
ncbi:MAG TPA: hypothetical protein VH138_05820, partial [Vicinamibacterales bacterium]|nr:hypothetical protein [Vicinamibacterales bacterium]